MTATGRRAELRAQFDQHRQRFEAANAKVTARVGRNLVFAVVSGLVMAAVFVAALLWFPVLLAFTVSVTAIGLYELATAFRASGRRVPRVGVIAGGVAIVGATWLWGATGLLVSTFFAAGGLILWRLAEGFLPRFGAGWRQMGADLASGMFVLIYIPFLIASVLILRGIPDTGLWWLFTLVGLSVVCDIGAYVAGINFGKHKLAPKISPGKTWEGFIGAALASAAAGAASAVWLLQLDWWIGLLLGIGVVIAATLGDLTESLIKRNLDIKDMSKLIPGHGGLLDRMDSILAAIVPVYITALFVGAL
ncbi:MAG: phosphatidate cytidylyltransferase [Microbacteriaceae bacterium]|nr:phosphatidate cytidylyltransferase [Microbacteriaceae bacterium]